MKHTFLKFVSILEKFLAYFGNSALIDPVFLAQEGFLSSLAEITSTRAHSLLSSLFCLFLTVSTTSDCLDFLLLFWFSLTTKFSIDTLEHSVYIDALNDHEKKQHKFSMILLFEFYKPIEWHKLCLFFLIIFSTFISLSHKLCGFQIENWTRLWQNKSK